jgi:hypothetical protein
MEMLSAQHEGVDMWSMHLYNDTTACWFDPTNNKDGKCDGPGAVRGDDGAGMVAVGIETANKAGAGLFVGEYGGANPNFTGPSPQDQSYPQMILKTQVADTTGTFVLSAIWAWECPSHRHDMTCIWPNSTVPKETGSNRMVGLLQQANANL